MDELETRVDLANLSVKEALRVRYNRSEQHLIVGERAAKIPPPPAAVSPWVSLVRYIQTVLGLQQELQQTAEVADPAMPLVSLKDVLPDFDPDDVSHIRWAFYYLKLHEPVQNDSPWQQVQGYLEAFEHFCQLQAWFQASELLLKPLDDGILLHDWLIDNGYAPEAILLYQTLLGRVNASMDGICWRGLGRAYYWLRDYPAAVTAWQHYVEQRQRTDTTPVLRSVYLPLGYAQYVTGDLCGAIATWNYCLPRLPEADIEAVPASFYLGLAYQAQGEASKACTNLHAILPVLRHNEALQPQLIQALAALGDAQQQQADLAAAIAAWEELLPLQPTPEPALLQKLGLAHAALAHDPETIQYLAAYCEALTVATHPAELDREPEVVVLAALGTAYYRTQALNDAIATLQAWADQQGSGFKVQSSGFKVQDSPLAAEDSRVDRSVVNGDHASELKNAEGLQQSHDVAEIKSTPEVSASEVVTSMTDVSHLNNIESQGSSTEPNLDAQDNIQSINAISETTEAVEISESADSLPLTIASHASPDTDFNNVDDPESEQSLSESELDFDNQQSPANIATTLDVKSSGLQDSNSTHSDSVACTESLDDAEFQTPNSELYRMLGDAYYQQANYALAQPYLTQYWQAIATAPQTQSSAQQSPARCSEHQDIQTQTLATQTLRQLGHCAHVLHDWPQVIHYLTAYQQQVEAKSDEPDQVSLNYQLGTAYYATEQYAQAIAPLQAYLTQQPDAPPETRLPTQFALGKAAYFSQDYTTAIAYLQLYLEPEAAPEAETALFYLGSSYAAQNDAQNTIQTFEQYLTLLGSAASTQEPFQTALFYLGKSYFDLEDDAHALEYLQKYFTLIQETSGVSREQFIHALNQAGQAYQRCGDYQSAIAHFEELQKLAQTQDNLELVNTALLHLGEIYLLLGRYLEAQQVLTQALENTAIKNPFVQNPTITKAKVMGRLGAVESAQGNNQKGRSICQKAMRLIRAIEDRAEEGHLLNTLGTIYQGLGDSDRALSLYQQAWNIARSMDNQRAIAVSLGNLGITYSQLGNYTQAIKHLQQSLPIAQSLGDRYEMGRILCHLGQNYGLLSEYPDARDCLNHALKMAQTIQVRPLEAETHYQMARLQFGQDRLEAAMDACEQAIAIALEMNLPALEDYRAFYAQLHPPLWRVMLNKFKRWLGRS